MQKKLLIKEVEFLREEILESNKILLFFIVALEGNILMISKFIKIKFSMIN